MHNIQKKILTDEENKPVAVQIAYGDWLEIEEVLESQSISEAKVTDLSRHKGAIQLSEDPLEYQKRIRSEWS